MSVIKYESLVQYLRIVHLLALALNKEIPLCFFQPEPSKKLFLAFKCVGPFLSNDMAKGKLEVAFNIESSARWRHYICGGKSLGNRELTPSGEFFGIFISFYRH